MILILSDWHLVAFHDAKVQEMAFEADQVRLVLDGVHLLPGHPANRSSQALDLQRCTLLIEKPVATSCRAYTSDGGTWENVAAPYPIMQYMSEVSLQGEDWIIAGFERLLPGRWLEIVIRPSGEVQLACAR